MKNYNGNYQSYELHDEIVINRIYSLHYFEYMSDFSFEGESHDFWEFCYVDKGTVGIMAGETFHILKKGEISFHKPNEFHNVKANGEVAPDLVVISFACHDKAMNFFKDRILQLDEFERNLLANIITEGKNLFGASLDNPYLLTLRARETPPFGSEQFIKLYLQHFLLHIIRRNTLAPLANEEHPLHFHKTTKNKSDTEVFERITNYLETHIDSHITIEQICKDNLIGRSQLQKLFQEKAGCGIIDYFSKLKINTAKYMIRNGRLNFTQISEQLGYTSIHYFSRQFKKTTGMTPSEYASSIKALSDK